VVPDELVVVLDELPVVLLDEKRDLQLDHLEVGLVVVVVGVGVGSVVGTGSAATVSVVTTSGAPMPVRAVSVDPAGACASGTPSNGLAGSSVSVGKLARQLPVIPSSGGVGPSVSRGKTLW